ncbi:hypothetical protein ACFSRY_01460 [Pontibacter locisalis]|uniref:Uncharacterized protein n=1 Tax=Pontibacter locisalis TaxID=1719035 RepID=A0ABW5IFT0_9BACT
MSLIRKTLLAEPTNSYTATGRSLLSGKLSQEQKEEMFDFSTIDGGMVNHNAGSLAISSGSGIFIGDYFVGVSDSYQSISNLPFVRY